MKLTHEQLETVCVDLVRRQEGEGALLILFHKHDRAELVAVLGEGIDLPAAVRQLAEEVESGGGMPLGRNLQTLENDERNRNTDRGRGESEV